MLLGSKLFDEQVTQKFTKLSNYGPKLEDLCHLPRKEAIHSQGSPPTSPGSARFASNVLSYLLKFCPSLYFKLFSQELGLNTKTLKAFPSPIRLSRCDRYCNSENCVLEALMMCPLPRLYLTSLKDSLIFQRV